MEAALKSLRKFEFLKDMEDAIIEIGNATDGGGTYLCSVPVDKEYQMEQKIVFIESNIMKNTPIGNSSGKILKKIVTKNLGEYHPYNFYDMHELVPLENDNFQTIEIKFKSITGEQLHCQNPDDKITHCHLLIRRFKKTKYRQSLTSSCTMWRDIFPKLSHIFNLLDNISILILLKNNYKIQKEIRGGRYLRINLLGQFISDIIEIIRPFLEDKRSLTFRNMDIGGCMCKFCQDIVFDTTIEVIGVSIESEIGSFKGFISRYIPILEYEMIENGNVNPIVCDKRIFFGRLKRILRNILNDLNFFYPIFTYNSSL